MVFAPNRTNPDRNSETPISPFGEINGEMGDRSAAKYRFGRRNEIAKFPCGRWRTNAAPQQFTQRHMVESSDRGVKSEFRTEKRGGGRARSQAKEAEKGELKK